ncbi:hypothetical protein Q9L58_005563 [Maublancomyces gigas]|uniref:BTB domain-containing protein n=1 Tax=Discina gigas TaxID=1032678 RepID=A0ABR3GI73_9PEZI
MHDSEPSLNASQVFCCDLYWGVMDGNDKGLNMHLEVLCKEALTDGDAVFSLPDNSWIWVHSLLFYIAAGNRLPSDFGTPQRLDLSSDVVEMTRNGLGVAVPVLYVTETKRPDFEKVINSCYTIDSLSGVWKAMGLAVVPNGNELERFTPWNPVLPTSLLPDFEIHLKEPKDGRSLFSVKVHKFLLARRIPYYETFFASGFGDASGMTSTLYTEEFTIFSLWAIASFIYNETTSSMFELYPTLRDYIAPSVAPSKSPCCATFDTSLPIPALEVTDKLLEIAKSAHYLGATNLENWAHLLLCDVAHQFQCQGRGCIEFIPHILNLVVDNDVTDRWVFRKGIALLAQHKSITAMWKRSLLNCKPPVLESLIESIQDCSEKEAEMGRTLQLFVRLSNLRRHTSTSKNASDWDKKLITPLMDHTSEILASKFDDLEITSGLAKFFRGPSFSRPIGEEILERVVGDKMLREENCRQVFIGIMTLTGLCEYDVPEIGRAGMKCISWFKRKWVTLSLTPAPITPKIPENNQQPDNQERDDKDKSKIKKPPVTTDANFFSVWETSELEELAKEILVPISDLLATSHRKKPPVDEKFKPVKTVKVGKPRPGRANPSGARSRGGASAPTSDIGSMSGTGTVA